MSHYLDCVLCGVEGPQVRAVLVEWLDPEPVRFSVIPRCADILDCRQRVEQLGESWPLAPTSREAVVS
jgi:hypothetical protein